jgi:Xaa-Pro dipeptidase
VRKARRRELAERLVRQGVPVAVIMQNADLVYYAGTIVPSVLVVGEAVPDGVLYVRRGHARAVDEAGDLEVRAHPGLAGLAREVARLAGSAAVGLELDVVPYALAERWRDALGTPIADVSSVVRRQRAVKDAAEVEAIRAAGRAFAAALTALATALAPGADDLGLTRFVEGALREAGSQGLLRMRGFNFEMLPAVVVAGPDGALPAVFDGPTGGRGLPYVFQGGSGHRLGIGEPLLVDVATAVSGYVHDATRTLWLGDLAHPLERALATAEAILEESRRLLRPGRSPAEVYAEAERLAAEAGLADHFQGYRQDRVGFLGHGVGLELDEWPVLYPRAEEPLADGMVVAVEPKFVFPGIGAVGVENTFVVRESGGEALTDLPLRLRP